MTDSVTALQKQNTWFSQWGAVAAVLMISLTATMIGWQYEKDRVNSLGELRFERNSLILQDDIIGTMIAYSQFLRGGVGLVHASQEVNREEWRQFVSDGRLDQNYPGIQGVSINRFVQGRAARDALVAQMRDTDWPEYAISPAGARAAYAPVVFLEPLSARNERAIGFDIYSEGSRRAAVDTAIATGEPTLTAKITLVQEDGTSDQGTIQAGVLLILPTYSGGVQPASASARRAATTGMIVSVFRMGDLIRSVYERRNETPGARIKLNLYDDVSLVGEAQLFGDTFGKPPTPHDPLFSRVVTIDVFGRPWTFQMSSTKAFEDEVATVSPLIILGAGILLSMLLTSLVLGQSQRNRETADTAEKLAANQEHIEFLMGEVNHRSKNLLSLVQAIARQTKADDPGQFVSQFSERVRALAASQDLLVRNQWKGISLNELIDSQLAHFEGLLGNRIQLNGPDIDINAEAAQSLGMAFHELATNAGKYGALSNDLGTVDIEWKITEPKGKVANLELAWLESGGPKVVAPALKGFGSKVTEMMAKYALDGQVDSQFNPEGFVWRLSCPAGKVIERPVHSKTRVSNRKQTV